ncbi:MAG: AI-2E family transporter [Gemmatimonadales bacterium]|nr:AI-2E family transporter [Gemmatimonadales bacterium]NIN48643.1 AI-2E family transporter [Gemmatimonadales bacterium]NIP06107.1 AI-2E family transporter [Gemmatimonadales bacterium]NIR01281.1 AI-2E family transporter [Gemmatimonadales bacterium]
MALEWGRRLTATLVVLFVAALVLLFLSRVREIVVLLFIAALFAVYLSAVTDNLVRRTRLPRPLALTLAILLTLGAVAGVAALILPPVVAQVQDLFAALPGYAQDLEGLLQRLAERYPVLERTAIGAEGGGVVETLIHDATNFVRGSLFPYLTAGGKLAVELVSVLAMAIYLARNPGEYRDGMISLIPPQFRHIGRTAIVDLGSTMRTWIWAQLFAMLVLGVLTAIGLWLLRVPYALAFGVFTGVVAIVPFFGTIVSTALPALLVLTFGGWVHALAVAGLGVGVHLVEANVVAPLIFEERVSLPPVLTILSVLVMATLLGVLGLIVAVPTLAALLVLLRHILFGEVYGEYDRMRISSAVLVQTTGERKVLVVPE